MVVKGSDTLFSDVHFALYANLCVFIIIEMYILIPANRDMLKMGGGESQSHKDVTLRLGCCIS